MSSQKRILLTGAAGRIGSAFFRSSSTDYTFRLADRHIPSLPDELTDMHEFIKLDVADPAACQQACQGIDTVIHLAADANPDADFYQSLLHNNIQGSYNIFRAAKDQGCQRVIFASSVHVLLGYESDVQAHTDSLPRPLNMYGVSKNFGEAVAYYFAHTEKLSSIAIRIGAYDAPWLHKHPDADSLSGYISERDMNHLLVRCIETPDIPFAIVHGLSNNRFKRFDISSTRNLLGYQPQDDAFEIFGDNLQQWLKRN